MKTHSVDLDTLCAFVGGEITLNQMQAQSYLAKVEQTKEVKREEHIRRLQKELAESDNNGKGWKKLHSRCFSHNLRLSRELAESRKELVVLEELHLETKVKLNEANRKILAINQYFTDKVLSIRKLIGSSLFTVSKKKIFKILNQN